MHAFIAVFGVLGLYLFIRGLATAITHKLYFITMNKEMEQYTPESCRAAAPFFGLSFVIIGIGFLAASLSCFVPALAFMNEVITQIIVVAVAVIVGFLLIVTGLKKLIKK